MASFIFNRWMDRLKDSAREEIHETARFASLYAAAGIAALMALIFLTLAGFWWLAVEYSAIEAALIVAGAYAAVALLIFVWASWSGSSSSDATTEAEDVTEAAATALDRTFTDDDMPAKMGVDLDSVAGTLSDAGYRMESLVVTASSDLVKQLTPLQFVSLVFVGSFLFGRRLRKG